MAGPNRNSGRELSNAALEAKDPDQLLLIRWALHKTRKREEQIRRDFREAGTGLKRSSPGRG